MKKVSVLSSCILICLATIGQSLTKFKENDRYGFKNAAGGVAVPAIYAAVKTFKEGTAAVTKEGKSDYDMSGEIFEGGKWGYIDETGKEIVPLKYDEAENFKEGFAVVQLKGSQGIIDKTGKVIVPIKYDKVIPFLNGLANVSLQKKWGYVDMKGKEVVPVKYTWLGNYNEGLASAALPDSKDQLKAGFVDMNGKQIIPAVYDYMHVKPGSVYEYYKFENGVAKVKKDGNVFLIDKQGNAIPETYAAALKLTIDDGLDFFEQTAGTTVTGYSPDKNTKYISLRKKLNHGDEFFSRDSAGKFSTYLAEWNYSKAGMKDKATADAKVVEALMDELEKTGKFTHRVSVRGRQVIDTLLTRDYLPLQVLVMVRADEGMTVFISASDKR